jgi:asparaginyl-tRNA synthetase
MGRETQFMTLATIGGIGKFDGQEVTIQGWLYNQRESGKLLFPQFRDGTGVIQGVVVKKETPEVFETMKHLTQESSLRVTGSVRADARAPGGYEMQVKAVEVLQQVRAEDPYPITHKEHGPDFLLERRHLWIRTPRQNSILRIRHEVIRAVRDYLDNDGFVLVDTPIFTPAACEGTTTLFECNYFDEEKAYLTQSGQLYNEATSAALGKTYCFGPTFRAEKSKTRRHLTEFWMVEPEMSYASLDDVMDLTEKFVAYIVKRVLDHRAADLATLGRDLSKLQSVLAPFPRISYDDAVAILKRKGSNIEWGGDFGNADETLLGEEFDRPVIIHRYPAAIKAFYMSPDPARPELALGADVIAPEGYGEIIGGGQRIHEYDLLVSRIKEHGLPPESFAWYLDLRKYGSVPHAGFGMGIERVVSWICGLEHLREAIAFPRMLYRIYP